MAVNALQYIKNVGKSFGYAAIDAFGEYNPQIKSLADGAKEFSSDLYQTIDDFKASMVDTDAEKGLIGQGRDIVNDLRKNLTEDLKSGNWYNKQRAQKAEDSMMEAMFGSFDDFDFDDFDFDVDDDGSSSNSSGISEDTAAVVSSNQKSARAIIDSMDMVGQKTAGAISTATVKSADYIVSANKQANKALYSLHAKGYQQLSTGLAAINQNMSAIVTLAQPLTTHMQNSATFFTSSAEYQKNVLEKLDTIIKNTAPPEPMSKGPSGKRTLSSILTSEGTIDFSAYFDMIKENVKSYKDDALGMLDMMGGPKEVAKMITSNPIGLMTKFMIQGVIPQVMKNSMESFNKTLGSVFGAGLNKIKNTDFKGPLSIFNQFKDIFMPKSDFKDKIDTSQYNKGKALWTGKSEKALQDVIPMYLSTIASALTGGPITKYNYETGKYVTVTGIKNSESDRMKRAAQSAGGEFRYDALNIANMVGFDDKERKDLKEKIENYFINAFKKGDSKATEINNEDFDYEAFGLDKKSLDVLRQVLKSYQKRDAKGNNNVWKALEFASNVATGRDDYGNATRRIEEQGGIETALYDNSDFIYKGNQKNKLKSGGLLGVDEYKHDIFWYLQKLYQHTRHVSDNIGLIAVGGRRRGRLNLAPIRDIDDNSRDKENQENISRANSETQKGTASGNADNFNDRLRDAIESINDPTNAKVKKKFIDSKKGEEFKNRREELRTRKVQEDMGDEEYNALLKEIDEEEEKELNKFLGGYSDDPNKIGSAKKIFKKIQSIFSKPAEVISEILAAGNMSMYNLIYGKSDDDEKGLFAYFFKKADNIFDKFDKFFEDKFDFSFKAWFKNLMGKAKETETAKGVKNELKAAGRWMKDETLKMFGFEPKQSNGEGETEDIVDDNGTAAFGRRVTRTGVVTVSEGEMIIPSEYNPFYHGTNNKRTQLSNEKKAQKRFFGNFANGGTVGSGRQRRNERVEKMRSGKFNAKDALYGSAAQIANAVEDFIGNIIPDEMDGEKDKINKGIEKIRESQVPKEMQNNAGAMGAGAIIGAGASILSGCIVGPLAGAAIGAAAGLVIRSEKVQNLLFGEDEKDEDGNVIGKKGGLLNKNISNFMTKNLPEMAKFGGVGMVGGLFMGSPVLGAVLGATVGYVKSSDKAKEALFGKQNEDGTWHEGLIKKDLQDKLKKNAPGIGAGMMAGAIAGPFGIVGNLLVGGAVGYVASSDQFKDYMFGKVGNDGKRHGGVTDKITDNIFGEKDADGNRKGGIVGGLRDYFFGTGEDKKMGLLGQGKYKDKGLIGAVTGIFDKLSREISIHAKNLLTDASKTLRSKIADAVKATLGQKLKTSKTLKAVGAVAKGAIGVAKTPFKALKGGLQGIDYRLGKRAIRNGYNLRNEDGSMMTASQRMEARDRFNLSREHRDGYTNLDRFLTSAETSVEDIEQLQEVLQQMEDPTKEFDKNLTDQKGQFATLLDQYNVDAKTARKLEKMVAKKDNKDDFDRMVSGLGLNETQLKEINKLRDAIYKNRADKDEAKANKKQYQRDLLNRSGFLGKIEGLDTRNDSDIRQYLQLLGIEIAARQGEDEEKRKEQAEENDKKLTEKSKNAVITIKDIIAKIYTHMTGETIEGEEVSTGSNGGSDTGLADERDDIVTQTTAFGDVMQYVRNDQGELTPDLSDSETRSSMESMGIFKSSIGKLGALTGIAGILGNIKDNLFGNGEGEQKEGIFSKLFKGLFGENGVLSGLFSLFTGSKIGSKIKDVLGKNPLSTIFTNVIAPALLIGGFSGAFDSIASNLTNGAYGSEGSKADLKTATAKDSNGNDVTVTWDESKQAWVDDNGNVYSDSQVSDVNVRKTQMGSFSDKLKYNTVRGAVTGTKSVASVVLGKTGVGKKVTAGVKAITSSIGDDAVAIAARNNLGSTLIDGCTKFTSMLRKVPALSSIADKLDDMGLALAEKMTTALGSQSAKKVAEFAKNAVVWAKVAFIVIDFTTGYEDARTTLGIVDEPTVGQKIISGLLRAIKNFIPIVGSLIPDSLVIDVFCQYVAPALGIDVDELMAQRQKAEETVSNWNSTHGADEQVESVGEFNKKVLKDYTWTERIGNAAKSTWEDTKLKAKNLVSGIKEKGVGGYLKDTVSSMGSTFMQSYKEDGGGISGIFSGIGDTFKSLLPGVLGDIAGAKGDIRSLAVKGDLGEMWKVSLPDFSGGGETIEGTDLTTAVPGIFSKIIGQIPLITTKITMTPVALVSKLFGSIKDFFDSDTFASFKNGADNLLGISDIISNAKKGDLGAVWSYSGADDEDNGFMKVVKTVPSTVTKVAMTVPTIFFAIGNKVKGFVDGIVNKVKSVGQVMNQVQQDTVDMVNDPDSSLFNDFFNFNKYSLDEEGNPIGGLTKAVAVVTRLSTFGGMLVGAIGKRIGDFIKGTIDKVKRNVLGIAQNQIAVLNNAKTGSVTEMWNTEIQEVEGSPINGLIKAIGFMNKIAYTPVAAGFWVGNKIKEGINNISNLVKTNVLGIAQNQIGIQSIAEQGDVSGVWDYQIQEVEGSPINGVVKAAGFLGKISATPSAIFHFVGGKIKDGIDSIVGLVKTNVAGIAQNSDSISELANNGDVSGVWDYQIQEVEGSPINGLVKAAGFMNKISNTPLAIFKLVGNKLHDFIDPKIKAIKGDKDNLTKYGDSMKEYAEDGDVSGVQGVSATWDDNDPIKGVFGMAFNIQKIGFTITAVINKIVGKVKDVFEGIWSSLKSFISGGDSGIEETEKAYKEAKDAENKDSGAGSGIFARMRYMRRRLSGGDSGIESNQSFVSQYDSRYAGKSFAGSTVGNLGCAPAAATMLMNLNRPGSMTMDQALKEASGYQQMDGTSADYFGHILEKNNMSSDYINTTNEKGLQTLMSNLVNGKPAVVLGSDPTNTSKDASPFGPNKHFITIKEINENGDLVVNDPESNSPDKVYSSDILKHTSLAVTSGKGNGIISDADQAIGGGNNDQAIWTYLVNKLGNKYGAAGLMGNLHAESGLVSNNLQNSGNTKLGMTDDQYTQAVDSGSYKNFAGDSIGYGLAQWTSSGRKQNLLNYVKSKGSSIGNTESQLEFLMQELSGSYKSVLDVLKSAKDVKEASNAVLHKFERPADQSSAVENKRANFGVEYYNKYSGSTETMPTFSDSSTSSGYSTDTSGSYSSSSSDSSSTGGFLSQITSAFSTGLGLAFGESNNTSSSSSGSSDYSSSGSGDQTAYTGLGGTGTEKQKDLVRKMDSVANKLTYSMSGARDPDKGSADCSSTVNWAYKKVFGVDVGGNTAAMLDNSNTVIVDQAGNMPTTGGKNGTGPTESNLQPGDILLYSRPDGSYTAGRKYRIGHVEMYTGDGRHIGHGGPGKGPTYKPLSSDANRYVMAKRLKSLVNTSGSSTAGAGSGLLHMNNANVGKFRRFAGGDSGFTNQEPTVTTKTVELGTSLRNTGTDNSVVGLLQNLISLVKEIVNNTSTIGDIGITLKNYCNDKISTDVSSDTSSTKSSKVNTTSKIDPEKDPALQDLMNTLGLIAQG